MACPALFDLNKGRTHAVTAALSKSGKLLALYQGNDTVSVYKIGLSRSAQGGSSLVFNKITELDESLLGLKRSQEVGESGRPSSPATAYADALVKLEPHDYQKRVALEKEVRKSNMWGSQTLAFDESGTFVLYPSALGVKMVDVSMAAEAWSELQAKNKA